MGKRIAIVGAGVGGLTLALELRRSGFEPDVYEATEELREVGAAVALSANATRFLRDRIGIGGGLAARSAPVEALIFRDGRSGREIARPTARRLYEARCGAPYYGIHRADLQQLLSEALGGVGLHLAKRVTRIDDQGPVAHLIFADGDTVETDLIIGADGVKSLTRRKVLGYDDAVFTGCFGWRGIVDPQHLGRLPDAGALQFWMRPGGHLLHYPIGSGSHNFLLVKRHVGPWSESAWVTPSAPSEHLAAFDDWHEAAAEMISAAPCPEKWALFHRPPLASWSAGHVTLLGDAAHPMAPHHGQGANQAIEDAVVLADCLAAAGPNGDWDSARQRYQKIRQDRTRKVQVASITTADVLHLPDGPAAQARNDRLSSSNAWDRHLAWIHEHIADRNSAPN